MTFIWGRGRGWRVRIRWFEPITGWNREKVVHLPTSLNTSLMSSVQESWSRPKVLSSDQHQAYTFEYRLHYWLPLGDSHVTLVLMSSERRHWALGQFLFRVDRSSRCRDINHKPGPTFSILTLTKVATIEFRRLLGMLLTSREQNLFMK